MKNLMILLYAELASAFSWGYGHYLADSSFFKWLCVVMAFIFAGAFLVAYMEETKWEK